MPVDDIRLDIKMPRSPKTRNFMRLLGDHGLMSLVRLWCYTAEYFPEGILVGMTSDAIEEEAGWKGDKGAFVQTALDERWLDKMHNGDYAVHDWPIHQPWVVNSKARSELARENAYKAWVTRRGVDPKKRQAENDAKTKELADLIPVREIIEYLNMKAGKNYSVSSRSTRSFISARWKDGFGIDDFKKVIDNQVAKWKGDPKWDKYLRPETLFNETKFQGYLNAPPVEGELGTTDTAGRPLGDLPL